MSGRDVRPIIVLGGTGQVGFELVRAVQGIGPIVAPARQVLDLSDLCAVEAWILRQNPLVVLNAAAYTAVDRAESDRDAALRINAALPDTLARTCARIGALLIHYSTDYVFDGSKPGLYIESDDPAPLNVYGESKLAGERAIAEAAAPHAIFRTSWVYGNRGSNFMNTMLRLANERDRFRIVGDQIGAPTWSRTIAELTAHLLSRTVSNGAIDREFWNRNSGVFHMCADGEVSWAGFASAIFAHTRPSSRPVIDVIGSAEYPTPAKRPLNSRMSTAKLCATFDLHVPNWSDALAWCLQDRIGAEQH
ncbi:dTDP-4-dehydrorhamnose reductase [Burkholderia multivorans]|uniref:dTDP-4-dehydrorhamnose reductase n=1 Tax=Burkholderia multivorans TaxID=87883 RepID=UPI0006A5E7BF|nr:dTDP-4-dehydrorhamnose reductase [Burkholderia multivorans]KOE25716.1 dTDP-4-dehydrorhamnose reductase [Burkholderia multivorans R-20526]MBU9242314.1 dTDP-4-dehydrorhamnose reductase [Burkholderia multivorans]MCO7333104.1 dTDP-4-dehydrorhamnose reductase [Burkholderia multivorans]MCO7339516.1 dTDP-4-dehydrorhamnose reductase [Burkholderia multivorans]MCO7345584.1 dTDP-4-dehydrorhamnose reductase [Burkholderia multivorans]